jgi:cell division initiation protein
MRLTPLDIQNHHFPRRFKGYDPVEVDGFLRMVTEDYKSLIEESEALKTRIREVEQRVAEMQGNEKTLQAAFITAQSMTEDLRHSALKESELVIAQAEVKAEKVLDASHRRAAELAQEISEMKLVKVRLATAIRNTIETHLTLLESLADEPATTAEIEDKIAYLTKPERGSDASPKQQKPQAQTTVPRPATTKGIK